MSELSRLSGVFFEPKKTFEDIARRPTWLLPLILVIIFSLVGSFAISQRVGWERVVRQQVESSSRAQQLSPEAKEQQIAMGAKFASIMAYGGSIVFVPIMYVIIAGVLLGVASGMMSAGLKFKQVLSVVSWGWLPNLIKGVLMIVVMYMKNPDDFNMKNPLAFNLGAFLDPTTASKFLYSVASSIDLFTIWAILLIAVGLKAGAGKKLSFGGAVFAVVLPWVIVVFAGGAMAGVFS